MQVSGGRIASLSWRNPANHEEPRIAPFQLRPDGRVERRVAAIAVVVTGAVSIVPPLVPEPIGRSVALFPAVAAAAIAAALLGGYLLIALAKAQQEPKLRWPAIAFLGSAAVLALRALALPGFVSGGGPLRLDSDNLLTLAVVSRFVLPAFVLCALVDPPARALRGATFAFAAVIVYAAAGPVPDLANAVQQANGSAQIAFGAATLLSVVAALAWLRSCGARLRAAELWILIGLFMNAWCSIVWFALDARFSSTWWSGVLLNGAVVTVPTIGLVVAYVSYADRLAEYFDRRERQLETHIELLEAGEGIRQDSDLSQLEARIRSAIQRRAFWTAFQPIVDHTSSQPIGLEALTRFTDDPARSPDLWLSDAARCGLREQLELVLIEEAVRRLPEIPDPMFLSLNVSPWTTGTAELQSLLSRMPVHRLVLEVTEDCAIDDYESVIATIEIARFLGLRVAIDDVGAGYASMRHVLRLRPDVIKLDRTLVAGVDVDPVQRALAGALQRFATDINAMLIAEGVETASQLDALRHIGVPAGQGYYFGRPGPLEAMLHGRRMISVS